METRSGMPGAWMLLAVVALAMLGIKTWIDVERVEADPPPRVQMAPDTTGEAIWSHLQAVDYRESWNLWPGTSERYEGGEPHGMTLTTYVNQSALQALNAGRTELPEGSVVVKENYMPSGDLAAVTVMYKRDGFNPQYNDWFFSKHLPSGELDRTPQGVAMEGRVQGCQNCHGSVSGQDFLFTERP